MRVKPNHNKIKEKLYDIGWKLYRTSTGGNPINISGLNYETLLIVIETTHNDNYVVSMTIEILKALVTSDYKYYDTGNTRSYARFGVSTEYVTLNDLSIDNVNYRANSNTVMKVFYK